MSLQTTTSALPPLLLLLLLVAGCAPRASADVSELLSAPPPDAFSADFRQAGQPPPQGDASPRGFPSQPPGNLGATRRVFFRLGDNPPLSDLQGLAARPPTCRDPGSCPETPFQSPNNFLRGFPNAPPSDLTPRVQNVASFPSPPTFSRSPVNSAPPLPLTAAFPNRAPPQIPMEGRPSGSSSSAPVRTSPAQIFNNAPPTQMTPLSDAPRLSFPNNAPATQLFSTSDAPRLSFSNNIPQPIFRSDTSRVSLPNRAPLPQTGSVSALAPLSFPNNAAAARMVFRPNPPQLSFSNGAQPTQLFTRAEAPRPQLANGAPLSQFGFTGGDSRFAPSNGAPSSQLVPRPEAFSLPQRTAISNGALCTPENPCNFPEISNEISAENKIPANYQFSYAVQDAASASDFSHEESAQEEGIQGQYRVLLPDGRQQIVSYRADEGGFRPEISYQ